MNDALTSFRNYREQNNNDDIMDQQSKTFDDLQAATEMVAETVENKGNDILDSVDDNTAVNELTAENTQKTAQNTETMADNVQKSYEEARKLNSYASQIDEKLRGFGMMMERKFNVVSQIVSGIDAIEEALKTEQPEITTPEPETVLPNIPENVEKQEGYRFFPRRRSEEGERRKKEQRSSDKGKNDVNQLSKAIRGGFKESVSISNQILNMLFRMTLTAIANAAKWGAILLSLVLAIDTVAVHLRHWSKLFKDDFDTFLNKTGEWAAPITKILTTLENIRDYWRKGQYGDLITALIKGFGSALLDAFIQLDRIITSGIASLMRALGFEESADELEYGGLQAAIVRGYKPTREEIDTIARVEKRRGNIGAEYVPTTEFGQRNMERAVSRMSEEKQQEYAKQKEMYAAYKKDESKTDEEKRQSLDVRLDVASDVYQAIEVMRALDPDRDAEKAIDLNERVRALQEKAETSDLTESDRLKLDDLFERFDNEYQNLLDAHNYAMENTAPVPPEQTDIGQQVARTEQAQLQQVTQAQTTNNTANVNNTQVINSHKTIRQGAPQTSTNAPGLIQSGVVK